MPRYLVVANRTLIGESLLDELRARAADGDATFHVVVPATHTLEHATWTEGQARAEAAARLDAALRTFAEHGIEATGEVGDTSPLNAVVDATQGERFDAVIVSTLPRGISRWVKQDLPHRIARALPGVQVIHIARETADISG